MNFKFKVLKDIKLCTPEYIEKLKPWIIQHQAEYFGNLENRVASESDFRHFECAVHRRNFCFKEEPMLIDRTHKEEHCYCICTISKNNTVTKQIKVIEINLLNYSFWKNGYFLLPILD